VSRRELLGQYTANLAEARETEALADAVFFEALGVPWWQPWRAGRLFDRAEHLRRQVVRLHEDNMALAVRMQGRRLWD